MVGCGGGIAQVRHTGAGHGSYSMTVEALPAVEDVALVDHRRCGVHVDRGRRGPRVAERRDFKGCMSIEGKGKDPAVARFDHTAAGNIVQVPQNLPSQP